MTLHNTATGIIIEAQFEAHYLQQVQIVNYPTLVHCQVRIFFIIQHTGEVCCEHGFRGRAFLPASTEFTKLYQPHWIGYAEEKSNGATNWGSLNKDIGWEDSGGEDATFIPLTLGWRLDIHHDAYIRRATATIGIVPRQV
jgi:hypothetical protein